MEGPKVAKFLIRQGRTCRTVQRPRRCLDERPGETEVSVSMQATRGRTESPRELYCTLLLGLRLLVSRIGGSLPISDFGLRISDLPVPGCPIVSRFGFRISDLASVGYHPQDGAHPNPGWQTGGQWLVGSFAWSAPSQKITEGSKGLLSTVGNRASSVRV